MRHNSTADHSPCCNSAEKVKNKIEKEEGGKCHIVECDLMKHEDCERVVKEHMEKYGKMSILVNNVSSSCHLPRRGKATKAELTIVPLLCYPG